MSKIIQLTQGYSTIVSREDYDLLSQVSWQVHFSKSRIYARTTKYGRMHRYILQAPPHLQVDHKNGNSLDNRRSNLRLATNLENSSNRGNLKSSKYRGVVLVPHGLKKWRAWLTYKKNGIHVGYYSTALEAALAYDEVNWDIHYDPSRLNFPERYWSPLP